MIKPKKRWKIKSFDNEEATIIAKDFSLHPMIAKILLIRGIDNKEKINRFFNVDDSVFYDPYIFNDMRKAVNRIQLAIIKNEKILIYGDYDADGVTSTSLLYRTLITLGADCSFYIPNRFAEGYGVNNEAIQKANDDNVKVIITVDTGIGAIDGAELAKELEISLIITDHHEPQAILPRAYAIINPKLPGEVYPFKYLAGVGVAFKLAHALLGRIPKEYIELVAIGTIADLVPLIDENRALVTMGLQQMQHTANIGIATLIDKTGLKDKTLSTYHIGFIIGPRINAVGRLESSHNAVRLLITEDNEDARKIVEELESINRERQLLVKKITEEAMEIIQEEHMENDKVLIVAKEDWNVGVIGIVAAHILKKYYKPVIVLSIDPETEIAKGSARSINGYNIYDALTDAKHLLLNYGGHPAAAGLGVKEKNIILLREKLLKYADEWLGDEDFIPCENIDIVSNLEEIDINLIQELEKLGPFGIGNPQPIILINDVTVKSINTLGNQKQHLKINIKNINKENNDKSIEAIYFNNGDLASEIANLSNIQLIGELNINEWRGNKKPQIIVRDMKIEDIQIFDWRYSYESNLDDLRNGQSVNLVFLHNEEMRNRIIKVEWKYILYNDWRKIKGYGINSIVLNNLPPSIEMLKELLLELPNLEKIYCVFENQDKWISNIVINRDFFKKIYISLSKDDSLRSRINFESYYKDKGVNSLLSKFILDIFEELEFIIINNDEILINSNSEKKDLLQSTIYQKYLDNEEIKKIFLYSNAFMLKEWFLNQFYK